MRFLFSCLRRVRETCNHSGMKSQPVQLQLFTTPETASCSTFQRLVHDVDDDVLAHRFGQNAECMFGESPAHQVVILVGRDQNRRDHALHLSDDGDRLEPRQAGQVHIH